MPGLCKKQYCVEKLLSQKQTPIANAGFMLLQINELKAENYEAEKDARLKVTNLQKQHEEAMSNLQVRNNCILS